MTLLCLNCVRKTFRTAAGANVHAVRGVSLNLEPGEALGLIGESGSGKSTLGRLALCLLRPDAGTIAFDGHDLDGLSVAALRALRSKMQVVFQEPNESLNPRMRIGAIVEEPLILHEPQLDRAARRRRVDDVLEKVGLSARFARRFSRDLSGGQQQRVGIARALVTRPKLVVLDEPTSSLDLSVRALILALLKDMQRELGLAYLFISHDIATVRYFCTRTAVMYLGTIVESGATERVIGDPQHPYTRALLSAALSPDPHERIPHMPLSGDIPSPTVIVPGCALVGRCPRVIPACSTAPVPLQRVGDEHDVACLNAFV